MHMELANKNFYTNSPNFKSMRRLAEQQRMPVLQTEAVSRGRGVPNEKIWRLYSKTSVNSVHQKKPPKETFIAYFSYCAWLCFIFWTNMCGSIYVGFIFFWILLGILWDNVGSSLMEKTETIKRDFTHSLNTTLATSHQHYSPPQTCLLPLMKIPAILDAESSTWILHIITACQSNEIS